MPKNLLFQFDTDPIPSTFDTVVGHDGGADQVHPYGGISPQTLGQLVEGCIFTRSPKEKQHTAIFVGGSQLADGEVLFAAIQKKFFASFRVSVMLDSNGSNTTAAAGVAFLARHGSLQGKRAVVLAGTGPVGQRAAAMLAGEGAEVSITSRQMVRARAAADAIASRFGRTVTAVEAFDNAARAQALQGAQLVFAAGAAGVNLLNEEGWRDNPSLQVLTDANATPMLGIAGIDMTDRGVERHGKIVYGAIGFGALKLTLHRTCIGRLFERNDLVLDAQEIYAIAKETVGEFT
jgi:hypothetical protein